MQARKEASYVRRAVEVSPPRMLLASILLGMTLAVASILSTTMLAVASILLATTLALFTSMLLAMALVTGLSMLASTVFDMLLSVI